MMRRVNLAGVVRTTLVKPLQQPDPFPAIELVHTEIVVQVDHFDPFAPSLAVFDQIFRICNTVCSCVSCRRVPQIVQPDLHIRSDPLQPLQRLLQRRTGAGAVQPHMIVPGRIEFPAIAQIQFQILYQMLAQRISAECRIGTIQP